MVPNTPEIPIRKVFKPSISPLNYQPSFGTALINGPLTFASPCHRTCSGSLHPSNGKTLRSRLRTSRCLPIVLLRPTWPLCVCDRPPKGTSVGILPWCSVVGIAIYETVNIYELPIFYHGFNIYTIYV